jgi:hypothetical protein
MEPIDIAYRHFCTFVEQVVPAYWDTIRTEADTRMKIIDKVFTGILGWPERRDQAGHRGFPTEGLAF